jgi:hypothetical protein
MIIKFEVNGAWQIYDDVDTFRYMKLGPFVGSPLQIDGGEINEETQDDGVIDFTESLRADMSGKDGYPGRVLMTFMNSKQLAESQIVAFSPIYLMNNDGRTVEII